MTKTTTFADYCSALAAWRKLTTSNSTYRERMAAYDRIAETLRNMKDDHARFEALWHDHA